MDLLVYLLVVFGKGTCSFLDEIFINELIVVLINRVKRQPMRMALNVIECSKSNGITGVFWKYSKHTHT